MTVIHLRRRVAAALLAGLLPAGLLGGCGWPTGEREQTAVPSSAAPTGEIAWRPCPELPDRVLAGLAPPEVVDRLTSGTTYECGTLSVPRDWDAPAAPERYDLALVRARSDDQSDRLGSLVVNPGGPGASGVESAVFLSLGPALGGLSDTVTGRFDLVGFDPRGVADSAPAVECLSDRELDESFGAEPDPRGREAFDEVVTEIRGQVETCAATYGDGTFSTRQTAHDLEALRSALGEEQLTFAGFSYGSLLGAVYAHLFPDRVRAMVLDGAVDPTQGFVEASEQQAAGFERALDNFADWCRESSQECQLPGDARAAVDEALADARRSPLPGPDGREATAGWVFYAVVSALYSQQLWPQLAGALQQLDRGDPAGVFQLADGYTGREPDGGYPNMFEANTVISCTDQPTDRSVGQVRELQQQWRAEYPVFGAPLAVGTASCALWPGEPDPYPVGAADGAPPIVVVGTTGDPATPYEATAALAGTLAVGTVVTVEGEGHTSYPENGCVADLVDAYLVDLTVPADDARCP